MAVIAVAGGMGPVGQALVEGLVQHGHEVTILSRKVCH
jgi:NAD dependent epimerase/dehydratase family enzyme